MDQATSLDGLQTLVEGLRDLYEVEHLIYHSVKGEGGQYAARTYNETWVGRYIEEDYARIDPVVLGCYQRFNPVDWKQLDWSGRKVRDFLAEAIETGVGNQGISVPIRGPNGQFAVFTVNHGCHDADWAAFRQTHAANLILIAHFINQKALEIERGSDHVPASALSPREADTLTLLALGLNRAQAAERLSISEHTLRVYLDSARFKLGAANTVQTVALALSRGLILV
ncbi:LuxR family transcriptional regulator [Maritimibacter sp. 55A14]|nr:LuxR family transcriptional regulator [Maritimibacter sp. 55A14]